MNKKLIGLLSMSMLLMSACGEDTLDTTEPVETEDQASENNTENTSAFLKSTINFTFAEMIFTKSVSIFTLV